MDTLLLAFIALVVLTLMATRDREAKRMTRRIAVLERKVDRILTHLDIPEPNPDLSHVRALAHEGKKIEAIKAYRALTDTDLREAKTAVERMTEQP